MTAAAGAGLGASSKSIRLPASDVVRCVSECPCYTASCLLTLRESNVIFCIKEKAYRGIF